MFPSYYLENEHGVKRGIEYEFLDQAGRGCDALGREKDYEAVGRTG